MNSSQLLYRRVHTLITCEGREEAAHARNVVTREAAMSVIKLLKKMQFAMILFVCFACFSSSLPHAPQNVRQAISDTLSESQGSGRLLPPGWGSGAGEG